MSSEKKKYRYMTPIEMPRGTHYGNNYWRFYSRKVNRVVTGYSNLECENLYTLEMNPEIEYFCEQPIKIEGDKGNDQGTSILDVYVVYKDGRDEFQEVKYISELEDKGKDGDACRRQISLQRAWCLNQGIPHVVRTEKEIELGKFYIRNLMFLSGKVRRFPLIPNQQTEFVICTCLEGLQNSTIGFLEKAGIFQKGRTMEYLAYLFYKGRIVFSNIAYEPITYKTEITFIG